MSFGKKSSSGTSKGASSGIPTTPTQADRSVILAGMMNLGLRESKLPQFTTNFSVGEGGGGPGRKPGVQKRALIGGA